LNLAIEWLSSVIVAKMATNVSTIFISSKNVFSKFILVHIHYPNLIDWIKQKYDEIKKQPRLMTV